jgi:hypothetical protein
MQSRLCAGGSAHTDEVENWSDTTTQTTSSDLTEGGGRQVITLSGPAYDAPERVTLLSVKGVVYSKGDSNALVDLLGVKEAEASKFWDQWIAIRPGQRLGTLNYSDAGGAAGFLSLCGMAQDIATSGASRIKPATIGGERVLAVEVPVPHSYQRQAGATFWYYLTDERWPRLVRVELHGTGPDTDTDTDTDQLTVSRWHEGPVMRHSLTRRLAATAPSLIAAGLLAGCGGGAPARTAAEGLTPEAMPATALVFAAKSALCAAASAHIDSAETDPDGSVAYSGDFTQSGDRELITSTKDGDERATVLIVGKVIYLQAGTWELRDLFGVSRVQSELLAGEEQAAGKWIAVRSGDRLGEIAYQYSLDDSTLCSLAGDLGVTSASRLTPATIGGQRVVGVLMNAPAGNGFPARARFAVYLTDDQLLRPVLIEVRGGGRQYTWRERFSRWDETVRLTPPRSFPASSFGAETAT